MAALCVSAQNSDQKKALIKKAEKLFATGKYSDALPLYSQLLSLHPKDAGYNFSFGVCLLFSDRRKPEMPLKYLEFAVKNSGNLKAFFYLGQAYQRNYRFAEAIQMFNEYLRKGTLKNDERQFVSRQVEMCRNGLELLSTVNDLFVFEKKMVNAAAYFRSYNLSRFGGKLIAKPEILKTKADKKAKDKSIVFFSDSNEVIFFSSYGDDIKSGRDIFYSSRISEKEWSQPERLSDVVNTPYDEDYPYLMPDGKTLFFSSTGHNSMGGFDIFVTTYDSLNEEWLNPINLDFAINTPYDDFMFVTDKDSRYAYFSSDRNSPEEQVCVYKVRIDKRPFAQEKIFLAKDTGMTAEQDSLYAQSVQILKNKAELNVNASPEMFRDTVVALTEKNITEKQYDAGDNIKKEAFDADSLLNVSNRMKDSLTDIAFEFAEQAGNEKNILNKNKYLAYSYARTFRKLSDIRYKQSKELESLAESEPADERRKELSKLSKKMRKTAGEYYTSYIAASELAKNYENEWHKKEMEQERSLRYAGIIQVYLARDMKDSAVYFLNLIRKQPAEDSISETLPNSVLLSMNRYKDDSLMAEYNEALVLRVMNDIEKYAADSLAFSNVILQTQDDLAYHQEMKTGVSTEVENIPKRVGDSLTLNEIIGDTSAVNHDLLTEFNVINNANKDSSEKIDNTWAQKEILAINNLVDEKLISWEKVTGYLLKQKDSLSEYIKINEKIIFNLSVQIDSLQKSIDVNSFIINKIEVEKEIIKANKKVSDYKCNIIAANTILSALIDSIKSIENNIDKVEIVRDKIALTTDKELLSNYKDTIIKIENTSNLHLYPIGDLINKEHKSVSEKDSVNIQKSIGDENLNMLISAREKMNELYQSTIDLSQQKENAYNLAHLNFKISEEKSRETKILMKSIQPSMTFDQKNEILNQAAKLKKEAVEKGREAIVALNYAGVLDSNFKQVKKQYENLSLNYYIAENKVLSGDFQTIKQNLTEVKENMKEPVPLGSKLLANSWNDIKNNEQQSVDIVNNEITKTGVDIFQLNMEKIEIQNEINKVSAKKKKQKLQEEYNLLEKTEAGRKEELNLLKEKRDSLQARIELITFQQQIVKGMADELNKTPSQINISSSDTSWMNDIRKQDINVVFSENAANLNVDSTLIISENVSIVLTPEYRLKPDSITAMNNELNMDSLTNEKVTPPYLSDSVSNEQKPADSSAITEKRPISDVSDTIPTQTFNSEIVSPLNKEVNTALKPESKTHERDTIIARSMFYNAVLMNNTAVILQEKLKNPSLSGTEKKDISAKITAMNNKADSISRESIKLWFGNVVPEQEIMEKTLFKKDNYADLAAEVKSYENISEHYLNQATELRKKISLTIDNREKTIMSGQADSLESLASIAEITAMELKLAEEEQTYLSNSLIIENIRPENTKDDRMSVAYLLEKESDIFIKKSDENGIKYNHNMSFTTKRMMLQDALTFSNQAVEKQKKAMDIYRKINKKAPDDKEILSQLIFKNNLINSDLVTVKTDSVQHSIIEKNDTVSQPLVITGPGVIKNVIDQTGSIVNFSESNVTYTVQIGAFGSRRTASQLLNLEPIFYNKTAKYWIYYSGKYNDYESALAQKKYIVTRGIRDAFVVAFRNGIKLQLAEAERIADSLVKSRLPSLKTDTFPLPSEKTVFIVQIGAFSKNVPLTLFSSRPGTDNIKFMKYRREGGLYIVFCGNYEKFNDAIDMKKKVTGLGFTDAFVIAVRNGRKIPITPEMKLK